MRTSRIPIWLLVCLFLPTALLAQSKELPAFRIKSDFVVVDLIATDKSGEFVSDLQPDEIEVYENGKKQQISFFQLMNRNTGRTDLAEGLREQGGVHSSLRLTAPSSQRPLPVQRWYFFST